jgi:hypothetical protein
MRHTGKKIVKIVEELTMYFISIESDKIESSIQREENQYIIRFHSIFNPEYRENLNSLEKYLNTPRNEAMEDLYWELAGSGDPGETSQLLLVGMMIDQADIFIHDNENSIDVTLYRKIVDAKEDPLLY